MHAVYMGEVYGDSLDMMCSIICYEVDCLFTGYDAYCLCGGLCVIIGHDVCCLCR